MDTQKIEKIESDLNSLIEKQAEDSSATQETQRWWAKSEKEYHEQRTRALRAAWHGFHMRMKQLHTDLAAEHEAKARALLEEPR